MGKYFDDKTEWFLYHMLDRDVVINQNFFCGMHYKTYMWLADKTKYINYQCNFNEEGRCRNHRRGKRGEKACCDTCAESFGYLRRIYPAHLKRYVRDFSKKDGYWRRGKGCILPRKLRSRACLTHSCKQVTRPAEEAVLNLLGGVWPKYKPKAVILARIAGIDIMGKNITEARRFPKVWDGKLADDSWIGGLEAYADFLCQHRYLTGPALIALRQHGEFFRDFAEKEKQSCQKQA